ncbi:hypothetical protein JRO89_XS04G0256700 [Xanthoceras sorbifolium]|uniref:RecA family profile 1 domain-containing protein n=1 Tax=Xanthoceras sorbifolium TaxID=99658 RepID=A0ABQ8I730_9ROSI|nr:hypothetical protein JRO89_XS04G0256700 [Xanthoceras sorbifolium]
MAPLKSLEREYPIIDSEFQNFCASHGIFSVEDFLINDLYELAALAEQQPTLERLKEGITQVLGIIDNQHQPWLNGMDLLEDALRNKHFLSTGFEGGTEASKVMVAFINLDGNAVHYRFERLSNRDHDWTERQLVGPFVLTFGVRLDLLLQGGFRAGQLTELVGPSSSGKTQCTDEVFAETQFCLQTAANVAVKHMGRVVYLDTGNSFSPQRIAHFMELISDLHFKQAKHKILQKAMSNIVCHSVFDIFAMFDVLCQLECDLRSQMDRRDYLVQLLIVDSVSSLITPVLGGSGSQGINTWMYVTGFRKLDFVTGICHIASLLKKYMGTGRALMISAGFLLKKLAHEHNLAVVVTNHTVGGEGGASKPALGESWKSVPHVRLLVSRNRGSSSCSVSILKHPSMASGKATEFVISEF